MRHLRIHMALLGASKGDRAQGGDMLGDLAEVLRDSSNRAPSDTMMTFGAPTAVTDIPEVTRVNLGPAGELPPIRFQSGGYSEGDEMDASGPRDPLASGPSPRDRRSAELVYQDIVSGQHARRLGELDAQGAVAKMPTMVQPALSAVLELIAAEQTRAHCAMLQPNASTGQDVAQFHALTLASCKIAVYRGEANTPLYVVSGPPQALQDPSYRFEARYAILGPDGTLLRRFTLPMSTGTTGDQ